MTPKELYDWAIEHGCEDYDIKIDYMFNNIFGVADTPNVEFISISTRTEEITIDI